MNRRRSLCLFLRIRRVEAQKVLGIGTNVYSTQLNGLQMAGLKESLLWFHAALHSVVGSLLVRMLSSEDIISLEHDMVKYLFALFPRTVDGTTYNRRYHHRDIICIRRHATVIIMNASCCFNSRFLTNL
ncbi:unnamed protein product, partial [Urochloa humidicola]